MPPGRVRAHQGPLQSETRNNLSMASVDTFDNAGVECLGSCTCGDCDRVRLICQHLISTNLIRHAMHSQMARQLVICQYLSTVIGIAYHELARSL